MSKENPIFELVRYPLTVRKLRVQRVRRLTPHMLRITLGGPELKGFRCGAPEDHVKLFFPLERGADPAVPRLLDGRVVPPTEGRVHARDYTPLTFDELRLELDFDFFLHGKGVAARWAENAQEGDALGLAGPRGSYHLRRSFSEHLFIGDETALPEFRERMHILPKSTRVRALLLVDDEKEEQVLPEHCRITWLHRTRDPEGNAGLLQAGLSQLRPFGRDAFFWLAGEAGEMRRVQRVLLSEDGIERAHLRSSGHWKRGVENHDHHQPIESS